ncbi:MAG: TauD/TfdA family dioxygenase [Gammaproteobacteria bacterium]|nr:TauD/TfdA family dioxygenase [Gammaproteobacteria bacterium]
MAQTELHSGELQPVTGPRVWRGPQLATRGDEWSYSFSDADLAELDRAIAAIEADGLDVLDITRERFRLPGLGRRLDLVQEQLQHGVGFALLRGLPVERYSRRQAAIAYFGIGAHLGEAVSQNARGHALGHVCDLGFDASLPTGRGYQTSEKLAFHTDPADIVGLLCLKTARSGGLSSIVSAGAVYNTMLAERPDLVQVLTETIYRDRRGEIPEGREPWYRLPVFNFRDGNLTTNYVRSTINKAQRFANLPRLTEQQLEAFAMIERVAADPALVLEIEFLPGDIQLLNDHYIMHSRTAYEDHPEPEQRRHLLRLWLATEAGPPLADAYYEFMGRTRSGRPDGYLMPGVKLTAPLYPEDGGPGESAQRMRA